MALELEYKHFESDFSCVPLYSNQQQNDVFVYSACKLGYRKTQSDVRYG